MRRCGCTGKGALALVCAYDDKQCKTAFEGLMIKTWSVPERANWERLVVLCTPVDRDGSE